MAFDLNQAPDQQVFELIPNGVMAVVRGTIRPGGTGDGRYETESKNTTACYLSMEFVVLNGPYIRRKFWQNFTVSGGKIDSYGNHTAVNMGMGMIKAMVESSRSVKAKDDSPEARQKRIIKGWVDLDGIVFATTIIIEKGKDGYKDQNRLGKIITAENEAFAPLMASDEKYLTMVPTSGGQAPATVAPPPAWGKPTEIKAPQPQAATAPWKPQQQYQGAPPVVTPPAGPSQNPWGENTAPPPAHPAPPAAGQQPTLQIPPVTDNSVAPWRETGDPGPSDKTSSPDTETIIPRPPWL